MRGFLVVVATLSVGALACSSPSKAPSSKPTSVVPTESVGTIQANPDSIEPAPNGHAPGPSWRGGPALEVAAGWQSSCEIRADHSIACWGGHTGKFDASLCSTSGECGQAHPPPGEFTAVSLGDYHGCALRLDGALACFGAGSSDQHCVNHECGQSQPPSGVFQQVSAGYLHSCAVAADGTLACWGAGQTDSACTIDQCGQAAPPAGALSKVAAGVHHSCALALDGTVQCWGEASEAVAPTGMFNDLFGGPFASCGLRSDDSLECWGPGGVLQLQQPPSLAFSSAAIGDGWACGIAKADGELICWGQNDYGNLNAPAGSFRQVALGDRHGCAIRDDDSVVCWGDNQQLESQPP